MTTHALVSQPHPSWCDPDRCSESADGAGGRCTVHSALLPVEGAGPVELLQSVVVDRTGRVEDGGPSVLAPPAPPWGLPIDVAERVSAAMRLGVALVRSAGSVAPGGKALDHQRTIDLVERILRGKN